MSAPPYPIFTTSEFVKRLRLIAQADTRKHKKALKTIGLLRDVGPGIPDCTP